MMITCSRSGISHPVSGWVSTLYFTLYSSHRVNAGVARRPFELGQLAPPRHRLAQLEVRDDPRDRRQPERERAVGDDRDDRQARVDVERREGADHAALPPADAARDRERV